MLNRRTRRGEQGQVIVLTALVFVFVLAGLLAVVGDLLVMENASAQARDAAFLGAQAGGQNVDLSSVENQDVPSSSNLTLAPSAVVACESAAAHADPGVTATCSISGGTITVDVNRSVSLPLQLVGTTAVVRAHALGGPAVGTVSAQ